MNKIINRLRFILNKKQKISFLLTTCLMIVASFLEMASVGFLIPVVSIIIDGDLQNSYINLDFLIEITQNFTNQELMLFVFSIFALLFLIKFLFTVFFFI